MTEPATARAPEARRAPSVALNVVANFIGKAWSGAIGLAFIPLYIRFLGVEAYGLIGIYFSLVALLNLLDMGLSSTLSRELARLSALPGSHQEARNLVRTMETIYWGIGLAIGLIIMGASGPIAHHWVHAEGLPPATVQRAIVIMGCVALFEWPAALYTGGLVGLQRQVLMNGVKAGMGTLQAVGAVLILWLVSPTILAYFTWQVLVVLLQTALLARSLWSSLHPAERPAAFERALLHKNWRFAAGMTGIAFLSTILMQLDKVVLSRYLTLESFGYYVLAFNVANALNMLVQPVFFAVFPRLSQLVTVGDRSGASALYHRTSQLLSLVALPVAIVIIFFSRETLLLWIRAPATVDRTYVLLSVIMIGSAFNAMMNVPYTLQLAYGWTRLMVITNTIASVLTVPLLLWAVRRYDAMGGAIAWIAINGGCFLFQIPFMHRRLLTGEMKRWYLNDNGVPIVAIVAVCLLSRALFPAGAGMLATLAWIAATWAAAVVAAAATHGLVSVRSVRMAMRSVTGG